MLITLANSLRTAARADMVGSAWDDRLAGRELYHDDKPPVAVFERKTRSIARWASFSFLF